MTNFFKIWTEESKEDKDENQYYLRLIYEPEENNILLAITKADGKTHNRNIMLQINEHMRACMFYRVDDDLPIKTDIHGIPLFTDYIKEQMIENGYKGNAISIPMKAMQEMMEKARELSTKQMEQGDKETKH